MKQIRNDTIKITKREINVIDEIEYYLKKIINIVKDRKNSLTENDIVEITSIIKTISKKEESLKQGLQLIFEHINSYKAHHKTDIPELQQRLNATKDKNKRKEIEEEILYQHQMIRRLDFMNRYEHKIIEFSQAFNQLLFVALEKLKTQNTADSLPYLTKAYDDLQQMKHIYKKQKWFEKSLLKLGKRTIRDLDKEKNA